MNTKILASVSLVLLVPVWSCNDAQEIHTASEEPARVEAPPCDDYLTALWNADGPSMSRFYGETVCLMSSELWKEQYGLSGASTPHGTPVDREDLLSAYAKFFSLLSPEWTEFVAWTGGMDKSCVPVQSLALESETPAVREQVRPGDFALVLRDGSDRLLWLFRRDSGDGEWQIVAESTPY